MASYKSKVLESKCIELIRANSKNAIVGCIYKHPSMAVGDFNTSFLLPLLVKASLENKEIYLLGDFNIDLLKPDSADYLDIFSSFSLLPHIILPTRATETTSTIIDNIFCNSVKCNTVSGNITNPISDHFSQFIILNGPKPESTILSNTTSVRDWKNFDHKAFLEEFGSNNWDATLQIDSGDPNLAFDNFFSGINSLVDKYAPIKNLACKKKKIIKSSPWIINGILTSIKKRDHLYKSFMREKNLSFKSSLIEEL